MIRRSRWALLVVVVVNLLILHQHLAPTPTLLNTVLSAYSHDDKTADGYKTSHFSFHLDLQNDPEASIITVPAKHFQEPKAVPFDPRLTLATLLHYLATELESKPLADVTIPFFHWGDYANLTVLDEWKFAANKKKCSDLDHTSDPQEDMKHHILKHDVFCIDDADIEESLHGDKLSDYQKSRLKLATDSPGFHVHKWNGRSSKESTILAAKSYLHDFLPPPLSLVLLLPGSTAVKIPISQEIASLQPLSRTALFQHLGSSVLEGEDATVDVASKLATFLTKLGPKAGHKGPGGSAPYEKHLTHEHFINNATEIRSALPESPDPHLQNYRNALDISLSGADPLKYFDEANLLSSERLWSVGGHHDWRFFNGVIYMSDLQPPVLHALILAWLKFVATYNINTWIAHGSLLSWYWAGMAFPWDVDFDVQMPIQDLHNLCRNFNQSIVMDVGAEGGPRSSLELRYGRYLVDCSTSIANRDNSNQRNNIDARFIDIHTGLYVDITGLAVTKTSTPDRYKVAEALKDVPAEERNAQLQIYNCKHHHFVNLHDVTPLRLTKYEGAYNYIPHNFTNMLIDEYLEKALHQKKFTYYTFLEKPSLWISTRALMDFAEKRYPERKGEFTRYSIPSTKSIMYTPLTMEDVLSEQDLVDFILDDKKRLLEYLVTAEITDLHAKEMALLKGGQSTEPLFKFWGKWAKRRPIRHDFLTFERYVAAAALREKAMPASLPAMPR